jgi:putative intracellular protease/amidase
MTDYAGTKKQALVILTNEAFLSQSSRKQSFLKTFTNPFSSTTSETPIEDFVQTHRNTGVDILEIGYIWLILNRQLNLELTFVSPRGGSVAFDPNSVSVMEMDEDLKEKLKEEKELMVKMSHTYPLEWIRPEDYGMVIIPGCHGAMLDLPEDIHVTKAIEKIYKSNGLVCVIGHGVSSLLNVKIEGEYLVKGKRMTCFSNAEEKEANFEGFVPFKLEEKLKERGAKLVIEQPFTPNVVESERLITAQSWPSAQKFVQKIGERFK